MTTDLRNDFSMPIATTSWWAANHLLILLNAALARMAAWAVQLPEI
jgi:hypothetical protein